MKNCNFKCQTCSKAFKMKHHLKAHLSRKFPCIPNYSILFQKKQANGTNNNHDVGLKIGSKKWFLRINSEIVMKIQKKCFHNA